jgi:hypothetical protein
MLHQVVTAVDARNREASLLKRSNDLRSWNYRDAAGHNPQVTTDQATSKAEDIMSQCAQCVKPGQKRSGNVQSQSHIVGRFFLFEQEFDSSAQVRDRGLLGLAFAERCNTGPEGGGRAPPTGLLVLLKDVVDVNDTCHIASMTCDSSDSLKLCKDV